MELDPRNRLQAGTGRVVLLVCSGVIQRQVRFTTARLAIEPNNVQVRIFRADLDLVWKADTRALHQVIEPLRDNNPRAIHEIADQLGLLRAG